MFPDRRSWGLWNTKYAGKAAFNSLDGSGYRSGGIFNRTFRGPSCRLGAGAWGVALAAFFDHINGDKTDNRLANLRDVTRLENARNMPRPKNNTSGVLGVSWSKSHGKWAARIKVEGRKLSAGHFDKFEDACAARRAANVTFGFNGEPRSRLKWRPTAAWMTCLQIMHEFTPRLRLGFCREER